MLYGLFIDLVMNSTIKGVRSQMYHLKCVQYTQHILFIIIFIIIIYIVKIKMSFFIWKLMCCC